MNNKFDLFKVFDEIQEKKEGFRLLEVSVRQGQILLVFEPDIISLEVFNTLSDMVVKKKDLDVPSDYSSIGFLNENPSLIINTNLIKENNLVFNDPFEVISKSIEYAADNVCKCPALEIVFSSQYIKCYLDKPGITVRDIQKYEEMFKLKGTLELFGQRPYLLLINDNFEE